MFYRVRFIACFFFAVFCPLVSSQAQVYRLAELTNRSII